MVLIRNLLALALAHLTLASPTTVSRDTLALRESGRCETFTHYCGHTLKKKGTSNISISLSPNLHAITSRLFYHRITPPPVLPSLRFFSPSSPYYPS